MGSVGLDGVVDSVPEVRRDSDHNRGVRMGITLFTMPFNLRKGERR